MKTLPEKLKIGGFDLTQIFRVQDIAIYRQEKEGHPSVGYEVVRIKQHGAATFKLKDKETGEEFNREVEEGESYPRSEEWGTNGWSLLDKDAAFVLAEALLLEEYRKSQDRAVV